MEEEDYPFVKNKILIFAAKWKSLEDIIVGGINQALNDKYCVFFSHMGRKSQPNITNC